ncbi:MAG: class A beta-lactamase [Halieaceae bacterium]|jgi:beta-lactamase class A|nr:class A beta-lactamase [Halieaceae bacterium]
MDSLAAGERESQSRANSVLRAVAAVEQELAASVGLYVRDVDSGELITHSADDRFPLNSTFKLFACAALLQRVESGISELEATVELDERQLIAWSPRIEQLLEAGRTHATIDELCAAMLSVSDNTAANLILGEIGGPPEFTRYMRTLGDRTTRLDRWEPELTEGLPGDARDTTSPRAIGTSLEALLLGTHLKPSSRAKLQDWLADHRVADDLFRSVLPENWSIHDRTGAGNHGTRGIVAVIYRPTSGPIVAAMYMRDANVSIAERNAAIARVGRAIFVHFGADYSASSPAFGQP